MSEYKVMDCDECCNCCKRECDVCIRPSCGEPEELSVFVPVIYDEVGINLCRTITIPQNILTQYPTTSYVQLLVANIKIYSGKGFLTGEEENVEYTEEEQQEMGNPPVFSTVTTIPGRANCLRVKLTDLRVVFNVRLFDSCKKYLATVPLEAVYLPAVGTTNYDPDTNPRSVTVDMYAPYGASSVYNNYNEYFINYVGFNMYYNTVENGINMNAVAKVMEFDPATGTMSAGITLYLRTVYYEAYKFNTIGKTIPPKMNTHEAESNPCLKFVEGDLLLQNVKPLELEPPKCEGKKKAECKERNEINQCIKKILNNCYSESEDEEAGQ